MNRVILIGNLGNDPEVSFTPSSQAVAKFSIAINEYYKDRTGQKIEQTEWVNIVAWGSTAQVAGKYLQKGDKCAIEGKMRTRSYEAKDGSGKRYITEVIAQRLEMLGGRPQGSDCAGASRKAGDEPPVDDDLPF
jgi:single-strand DNA-binding protein